MYDFISGSLAHSDMTTAVIDCSGVGYKLFISMNTYKKISGQEKITLKTYLNVKEDALDLYGFYDEQERLFFTFLISVNGVGPKVAMAVLSDLTPEEFAACVIAPDVKRLTKVPGVGPKMAQRICLELKDKISKASSGINSEDTGLIPSASVQDDAEEAVSVLTALGYTKNDARSAIMKCSADNTTDLVKQALRFLSRIQ